MTQPPNSSPDRAAPIALWRIVEAFLRVVFSVCGNPEEVARRITLTAKARAIMLPWLNAAEALMRQILLVEAAALAGSGDTHARRGMRQVRAASALACVSPPASEPAPLDDDPANWRVSFKALPPTGRQNASARASAPRRARRDTRFHSARPIAVRLEALLRVFNAPMPYARRLAKRLRLAPRLLAAFLVTAMPSLISHQDFYAVSDAADAARAAFNTS
ncbi:MAG: hypothetical protein AB7O98_17605 [Hyphomonadaceae bacterium]